MLLKHKETISKGDRDTNQTAVTAHKMEFYDKES